MEVTGGNERMNSLQQQTRLCKRMLWVSIGLQVVTCGLLIKVMMR